MRLKKGFTLAEILIVLMVIGVIATMTIPSMMKGVTEAQLKTGYKKAYNTISNFAAMEKVAGTLPARGSNQNINSLYKALNASLSVKGYGIQTINAGSVLASGQGSANCLTLLDGEGTIGTDDGQCAQVAAEEGAGNGGEINTADQAWIITEDNIAYAVVQGGRTDANADTKQQIAAADNDAAASGASSAIIIVDVNGLSKGPNTFEVQGVAEELEAANPLDTITGDQYKIYIGSDGATAGPKETTVTGRIVADLK